MQSHAKALFCCLADIEEAENGDQGRVRYYLARAVRAPRDPAWVADGIVSDRWAPVSPVTGRLDAFEWRMPVERLGPVIEADGEEDPAARPPVLLAPTPEPEAATETAPEEPAEAEPAEPAAPPAAVLPERPQPPVTPAPQAAPAAPPLLGLATRPSRARPNAEADDGEPGLPTLMPDDPGVEGEDEHTASAGVSGCSRVAMFDRIISFLRDIPGAERSRASTQATIARCRSGAYIHVMDADGVPPGRERARIARAAGRGLRGTGAELDALVAAGRAADRKRSTSTRSPVS